VGAIAEPRIKRVAKIVIGARNPATGKAEFRRLGL
jgi:hypothetical protein